MANSALRRSFGTVPAKVNPHPIEKINAGIATSAKPRRTAPQPPILGGPI
jgi:hypothetical protein